MSNLISQIAKSYIGQHEKPNNGGFLDPKFELEMAGVGFYHGAPWCGYFAKLVWKKAGQDTKLMNGSAWRTALNLQDTGFEWSAKPVVGALVVWRSFKNGKSLSTGHIGVVAEVLNDIDYVTIEGNTTDKGGREGVCVAQRNRKLTMDKFKTAEGLRLMGFVYPK